MFFEYQNWRIELSEFENWSTDNRSKSILFTVCIFFSEKCWVHSYSDSGLYGKGESFSYRFALVKAVRNFVFLMVLDTSPFLSESMKTKRLAHDFDNSVAFKICYNILYVEGLSRTF